MTCEGYVEWGAARHYNRVTHEVHCLHIGLRQPHMASIGSGPGYLATHAACRRNLVKRARVRNRKWSRGGYIGDK
jgi:hypothetical protein